MKLKTRIAVLSVLVVAAAGMSVKALSTVKPADPAPQPVQIAASQPENARYYLRESGGFVAVFAGDNGITPLDVTDIEVTTLTEVDRELMRVGIPAENKTELLCLLEDLGS